MKPKVVEITDAPLNPNFHDEYTFSLYKNEHFDLPFQEQMQFHFKSVNLEDFFGTGQQQTDFEKDYWDKNFLHLKDIKKRIYNFENFESDLQASAYDHNVFTSYENARPFSIDSKTTLSNFEQFQELKLMRNTSCRLLEFDRFTKASDLKRMRDKISLWTQSYVHVTSFFSSPGQSVIPIHWDTENLFIYQAFGKKKWLLVRPTLEQPMKFHNPGSLKNEVNHITNDGYQVLLEEGDLLYVPRGWFHKATAEMDIESLHITFGISTPSVLDNVIDSVTTSLFSLSKNQSLRQLINTENPEYISEVAKLVLSKISANLNQLVEKDFPREWAHNYPMGKRIYSSETLLELEKIMTENLEVALVVPELTVKSFCKASQKHFIFFEGIKFYASEDQIDSIISLFNKGMFKPSQIMAVINEESSVQSILLALLNSGSLIVDFKPNA